MRPLALAAVLLLAAGCDGGPDDRAVVFGGVTVAPRGAATLDLDGGALVVSGLGGSAEGGFAVAGNPSRLDVRVDPVTLPAGARWGVTVEDASGQMIARMAAEGVAGGVPDLADLRFAFPTGTASARVTYRLAGAVVFTIPDLPLTPTAGRVQAAEASAGSAEGKAGSTHVIRNASGQYVVVSDAEEGTAFGGCAGFVVRPPVPLPVDNFPDGTLCADWVEAEPRGGPVREAAATVVGGRGMGAFTVRTLEARF